MTRFYPLLFVLLWSTGFIGARYGLPYAEPLSFLCLRYGLVIVLMGAVALATRAPWPQTPRQWLHIGLTGLLVHGVYLGGVFTAISHGLPAGIAALVVGLQPLLTALGAGLLLGEKVRPRQWGGLVLGLAGVALVVSHKVVGAAGTPQLAAMLGPVLLALAMRAPWPASPRDAIHIGVTGLLVQALYLGGVFMSIHRGLPAGVSALVVGMQPLLTAALAGVLLGERVSARQWTGLALGFGGVALVVGSKANVDGVDGDALIHMLIPALAALLGITAGTLYQKRYCPRFDLRTGSVLQFLPSLALTALIASQTETMVITWTDDFVFALGWLVLVLSVGAISLLNLLIRSGSAVNVASLFYLTPPTTALIAWAMFGETLSALALAGMALAVSGVWLARKG